jgi:hypothetical protein
MVQQRHAGEAKQPLRIVNGVNSPGKVVDSRRNEYEAMKLSSANMQVA